MSETKKQTLDEWFDALDPERPENQVQPDGKEPVQVEVIDPEMNPRWQIEEFNK